MDWQWCLREKAGERLASLRELPGNALDVLELAQCTTPSLQLRYKLHGDRGSLRWNDDVPLSTLRNLLEKAAATAAAVTAAAAGALAAQAAPTAAAVTAKAAAAASAHDAFAERCVHENAWLARTFDRWLDETPHLVGRLQSAKWTKHATDRARERFTKPRFAFSRMFDPGFHRRVFRTRGLTLAIPGNQFILRLSCTGHHVVNLEDTTHGGRLVRDDLLTSEQVSVYAARWCNAITAASSQHQLALQPFIDAIEAGTVVAARESRVNVVTSHGVWIFSGNASTLVTVKAHRIPYAPPAAAQLVAAAVAAPAAIKSARAGGRSSAGLATRTPVWRASPKGYRVRRAWRVEHRVVAARGQVAALMAALGPHWGAWGKNYNREVSIRAARPVTISDGGD
jgi:hypothetical protein